MTDPVPLPGGRDARGALDVATAAGGGSGASGAAAACAVACPPHPQHGGHRADHRLRAVSDELVAAGSDCFRFDYGPWDGGRGERADALHAVEWATHRYDRVALFGYSFGAAVAVSAAARGADVTAVAAVAPPASVGSARNGESPDDIGVDTVAALESLPASLPVGVFYGSSDDVGCRPGRRRRPGP